MSAARRLATVVVLVLAASAPQALGQDPTGAARGLRRVVIGAADRTASWAPVSALVIAGWDFAGLAGTDLEAPLLSLDDDPQPAAISAAPKNGSATKRVAIMRFLLLRRVHARGHGTASRVGKLLLLRPGRSGDDS